MAGPKSTPKDAQIMNIILKDMGVTDYEPRVINQMLEFAYRCVTDVLDDAKIYSNHANKKNIDVEDVKMAIQCKMDHSFTTPPPRDMLMELARHKNNTALPVIKPYSGINLPPLERYCLVSSNYRLKSLKKQPAKMTGLQGPTLVSGLGASPRIANQPHSSGVTAVNRPLAGLGQTPLGAGLSVLPRGAVPTSLTIRPAGAQAPAGVITQQQVIRMTSDAPAGLAVQPAGLPTPSTYTLSAGGLKRKREDDDYDNP